MQHNTLNIGRVIKTVGLITIVALICWYFLEGRYWSYLPNLPEAENLAKQLVAEKRDPKDCFKTYQLVPSYPPLAEARFSCVRTYAELTQNPVVCELLMPSSYGLSCVGGAMKFDQCNFRKDEVSWAEDGKGYVLPYAECGKFDSRRSVKGNACCTMALVAFVKTKNDCSSLASNTVFFDECQFDLGIKNHDPSACDKISDPNIKAGCLVDTKALKKDPSICDECTKPVDDIKNLK